MLFTLQQAANFLGVHRNTLYKLAQQGKIPAAKVGNQWRFEQEGLTVWIGTQMRESVKRRTP